MAAVELLGKVLGPIGWLKLVWSGEWPIATLVLCVPDDLIWWVPFGLYLYDAWRTRVTPTRSGKAEPSATPDRGRIQRRQVSLGVRPVARWRMNEVTVGPP